MSIESFLFLKKNLIEIFLRYWKVYQKEQKIFHHAEAVLVSFCRFS